MPPAAPARVLQGTPTGRGAHSSAVAARAVPHRQTRSCRVPCQLPYPSSSSKSAPDMFLSAANERYRCWNGPARTAAVACSAWWCTCMATRRSRSIYSTAGEAHRILAHPPWLVHARALTRTLSHAVRAPLMRAKPRPTRLRDNPSALPNTSASRWHISNNPSQRFRPAALPRPSAPGEAARGAGAGAGADVPAATAHSPHGSQALRQRQPMTHVSRTPASRQARKA
jgi:hypothetical protein